MRLPHGFPRSDLTPGPCKSRSLIDVAGAGGSKRQKMEQHVLHFVNVLFIPEGIVDASVITCNRWTRLFLFTSLNIGALQRT